MIYYALYFLIIMLAALVVQQALNSGEELLENLWQVYFNSDSYNSLIYTYIATILIFLLSGIFD